ncbi:hypothetical protein LJR066_003528 [Acidovorax sp. LjRoot66]|uniref:hypothetical protein n=1 Tax=Acidovorax sp. LjRoot66 TaxID=3342334 RepID=UPI003ECFBFDC
MKTFTYFLPYNLCQEPTTKAAETAAWTASHTLAAIALIIVLIALLISALVIMRSGEKVELEVRRIRFAAATFTGILILFIFTAILYFADHSGRLAGKEIFEKAVTAMTPLAGVIIGYLFGTKQSAQSTSDNPSRNDT